jgi:hypothetical protein
VTKLNSRKKSKKLLLVTTAMTIMALATVLTVYAVLVGTYSGGEVAVGGTSGAVTYSSTNSEGATWSASIQPTNTSDPWFARLQITYSGPITITWQLETKAGESSWSPVSGATVTTNTTLTGTGSHYVYASDDGTINGNLDWSTKTSISGIYRVTATVNSA